VSAQNPNMRMLLVFGLLSLLAACSGDPSKYGITGPGNSPPPAASDANPAESTPTPGVPTFGPTYGPSIAPSTGSSGFWGYN
jgi:hypothetical protein